MSFGCHLCTDGAKRSKPGLPRLKLSAQSRTHDRMELFTFRHECRPMDQSLTKQSPRQSSTTGTIRNGKEASIATAVDALLTCRTRWCRTGYSRNIDCRWRFHHTGCAEFRHDPVSYGLCVPIHDGCSQLAPRRCIDGTEREIATYTFAAYRDSGRHCNPKCTIRRPTASTP